MKSCRVVGLVATCWLVFAAHGVAHAGEVEFTFTSSYDQTKQLAAGFVPSKGGDKPRPLLVVAHYLGGNRNTAKLLGYYEECEKRSWLVVCPELHGRRTGGATSLAALEAQHDVIDAIATMKRRYKVDASRIYVAGRSMGGMLAAIMAAKYPDVFAGAVAGQGISDLERWVVEFPRFYKEVVAECGPRGAATAFEYRRRSSIHYATNLQYVPLILWHGTNDTWVWPQQSQRLDAAVRRLNPYQRPVVWLQGAAHCADNYSPAWICEQLRAYQNKCELGMGLTTRFYPKLDIVTDEDKAFFWLGVVRKDPRQFARVGAELRDGTVFVNAAGATVVTIDMRKIAKGVAVTKYDVHTDTPLELRLKNGPFRTDSVKVDAQKVGVFGPGKSGGPTDSRGPAK